jgi:hypothetical protein
VGARLAGIVVGTCFLLYNPALQVCLHTACHSHLRSALPGPCPPLPGIYSDSFPGYPQNIYKSSRYHDKLMLAAGWLYRATGQQDGKLAAQHGMGRACLPTCPHLRVHCSRWWVRLLLLIACLHML